MRCSERVEAGETITITVDGRPVALLQPLARRPRWLSRSEFVADLLSRRADPQLASDLELLAGETTDDVPFR